MFFRKRSDNQRDLMVAYKQTFSSGQGREVLLDLMNRFHILQSHNGDLHKEGQRSVVLDILNRCHINLEEYDKLLKGE